MLLRIGVIAISFSVMLVLVLVAVLTFRDSPEEVAAAQPVAASPEPTTKQVYQDPRDKMLDIPSPGSKPAQAEPVSSQEPASKPEMESIQPPEPAPDTEINKKPAPSSETASVAQPEVEQKQDALPLAGSDWPVPNGGEIARASQPRHYDWTPGAVLSLSVKSIGLHNAPVMGTDSQQALDNGVVHVPGTSMPWTRSPQRNVYLAGHRLGWPGTGSRLIFYNLNKLKSGDKVTLKDRQGHKYRYQVSNIFVVGPEESWVTGQIRNRDMVTLQTCTGPNFSKRLIVRADRV